MFGWVHLWSIWWVAKSHNSAFASKNEFNFIWKCIHIRTYACPPLGASNIMFLMVCSCGLWLSCSVCWSFAKGRVPFACSWRCISRHTSISDNCGVQTAAHGGLVSKMAPRPATASRIRDVFSFCVLGLGAKKEREGARWRWGVFDKCDHHQEKKTHKFFSRYECLHSRLL